MTRRINFKKNPANIFLLLSSLLLLVCALLIFVYFERQHKQEARTELQASLSQQASDKQNLLNKTFKSNAADVRFLTNTPPITGIIRASENAGIDQIENTSMMLWQERLAKIFYAFMSSQRDIAQIRYIGADNNGKELVRVERQHGSGAMRIIPDNRLQPKGERRYFQKTSELNADEIYISDITLNREFGRLDYPLWPTYRVATPVFDNNGEFFGIVIINYNAELLLQAFQTNLPQDMSLFITNTAGHYLAHPRAAKSFEYELDDSASSRQNDFTLVSETGKLTTYTLNTRSETILASQSRVNLTGDRKNRYIDFIVSVPQSKLHKSISNRRQASTVTLFVIILIGGSIILVYRKILLKQVDLNYAQSQYSAVIESSRDAILTLTQHGKVNDWNEATYDILKLPPFSIAERALEDIIQTDDQSLSESVSACLAGQSTPTLEISTYSSNNELLALSVSLSPIYENKRHIVGVSTIIRDITEQTHNKQLLEQLNASLEEKVKVRTEELEKAKNEAIEASQMKSSFVANVSHEIRTPLNGILGMHNLLKRENLSQRQQSYLEMATHSAKSLLMLINDILDLSKIEAGKLEVEQLPVNLIDTISQAANSMAARAMDKNVELVLDLADIKHPIAMGDSLRIKQILNNLISNAIKFTEKGEILITAATKDDVVNDRLILNISIKDSGVGIEENKLNRLFKAFSQEDISTTRKYGGTGLGLSIVHNLCALMGGECHVESQKGIGSTFSFSLTLKSMQGEVVTLDNWINLTQYTIQIVESSPTVKKALDKLISSWGATTILDGDRQEEAIDIVISQLGQNGLDDDSVRQHLQTLSGQDFREQFIFTLTFKQRHSLENSSPSFAYRVIYRPIMPIQLATVLSELTGEPMRQTSPTLSLDKQSSSDLLSAFKGTAILVVDDNEINQRVAEGILDYYGMTIQLASNGAKAIQLLNETADIALILMDCQMPVMDGFQTTEAIRHGDAGTHYKKIPIIAMTAGAMTGDREECISAGMNDYIAKPLSADDLEAKISQWLQARNNPWTSDTQRQVIETQAKQTSNSADKPFWEHEASLARLLSNEDLFIKMLEMFEQQTPDLLNELDEQLKQRDFDKVKKTAHKLKGSASAIGAIMVLDAAHDLEKAATEEQETLSDNAADSIQQEVDRMLAAINAYKKEKFGNQGPSGR
ncbi:ATP-binding protein [Methylophaga sp.]|uniref:ATP-binding protein n=1 Tax=Methylophaga sp. TaxID=2024840 RepID=UPI003F6A24BE